MSMFFRTLESLQYSVVETLLLIGLSVSESRIRDSKALFLSQKILSAVENLKNVFNGFR